MGFRLFGKFGSLGGSLGKRAQGVSAQVNGAISTVKSQMGLPIGIDFGVASMKILQVSNPDAPSLVAAACLETPDDLLTKHEERLDFQIAALPRLVKNCGFKGKRAVCAIPAWQTICKHLQFPRTDNLPLSNLVSGAITAQLQCDPASLVFRHIEVGDGSRTGGKTEVICLAVSRDLVETLMGAMQRARLQPVGMHSEFAATLKSFDYVTRRQADAQTSTLYIDMGAYTTKVMIAHGPDMVFARCVELGGSHLDELVARQLKCHLAEARSQRRAAAERIGASAVASSAARSTAKAAASSLPETMPANVIDQREGSLPAGFSTDVGTQAATEFVPPDADLSEPLEILTDEIQMSLRYHAAQFPGRRVERAVFVGGESSHTGLCQHIARAIRLPAQTANPMARIGKTGNEPSLGVDLHRPQPGWAVALGLCLGTTDL